MCGSRGGMGWHKWSDKVNLERTQIIVKFLNTDGMLREFMLHSISLLQRIVGSSTPALQVSPGALVTIPRKRKYFWLHCWWKWMMDHDREIGVLGAGIGCAPARINDVNLILNESQSFIKLNQSKNKRLNVLNGKTQINLFFEPSTRTQSSFELAGKRLGADVMSMNMGNSAIKKGETLIDTAMTLNAMHPDIIVIRHQDSGACNLLSQKVNCAVLNAGDGRREHPTQALLDALTIINRKKKIQGLKIAICGDILHSRVARSNIYLLTMLGAEVNIVAPTNLMPKEIEKFGVNTFTDMKKGLKDCDIVMMLRLQNERMTSSFLSSNREYYEYYGLTPDKLDHAKPDAIIMHPGPMNRGIEIDTRLADDINKSVIKEQVELGVAVRMACLKIFCE